ncbi:MAG: Na/Pi cotransporter family protein [Verrucomicrobiales bacterium]|nr:Na/Pi cotransporter family protein [Verrucomicrobiales bacterium]
MIFTILEILGSVGVFLYGMKVLSEGIQKVAGQKMRKFMETMTRNRFSGIMTGFLTTCLLQSSSATTVIVVSFVNAGLLTLIESIGVVMGANLGTTLTAWIIALIGKFSLSKIALPIIGVGLPFLFIGKNRIKSFGEVLIGFGLLFFGLGLLKNSVPDVHAMLESDNAMVAARATATLEWIKSVSGYGYFSLLIFLTLGVILTLMVQSSSAAMAITVTLAVNGWIGFEESAAIVLGENIGTTVTAWLASIGANLSARRAARAHFMFNVLGVLWMLLVFYAFTPFVQQLGDMLPKSFRTEKHSTDMGFDLAIFHSLFNALNIILLVGFVPLIASIVTRWVKAKGPESDAPRLKYISQNMLNLGELNLPEAESATREFASLTKKMFEGFTGVFAKPKEDLSSEVVRLKDMEDDADVLTHDITEYLVRCSAADIGVHHAGEVASMLRIVAELEEISDCIYRLVIYTERKYKKKRDFSPETQEEVLRFASLVSNYIDFYIEHLFSEIDAKTVEEAEKYERRISSARKALNKSAMKRMPMDEYDVKTEMLNIDINNHLEKIASHATNVINSTYYLQHGDDVPDKYLDSDL